MIIIRHPASRPGRRAPRTGPSGTPGASAQQTRPTASTAPSHHHGPAYAYQGLRYHATGLKRSLTQGKRKAKRLATHKECNVLWLEQSHPAERKRSQGTSVFALWSCMSLHDCKSPSMLVTALPAKTPHIGLGPSVIVVKSWLWMKPLPSIIPADDLHEGGVEHDASLRYHNNSKKAHIVYIL